MAGDVGKKNFSKLSTALRAKTKDAATVEQLLAPSNNDLRFKLIDMYFDAMVEDVQAAAEADLDRQMFRCGFHMIIDELRRLKADNALPLTGALAQFFAHANGLYTLLIATLCEQHGVAAGGIIDPHCVRPTPPAASPQQSAARAIVVRALLSLGDLARYAAGLEGEISGPRMAEARRRYYQARVLMPNDGAALNQLAVLATHERNGGVDAAFFYLCSLATARPFSSALANVTLLLEKARGRSLPALPALAGRDPAVLFTHRAAIVTLLCVGFLRFHDSLLRRDRQPINSSHVDMVAGACEAALALPAGEGDDAPSPRFFFRLLCTNMLTTSHLTATNAPAAQLDGAVTLSLRLFIVLCNWLTTSTKAGGPASNPDTLQPWLATVRVMLQWLSGPAMWDCLLSRRETPLVGKLWPVLAAALNAVAELDESRFVVPATIAAALPEDVELHGVAPLAHVHRDLDFTPAVRAAALEDQRRLRLHGVLRHARMLAECGEFAFSYSVSSGTFASLPLAGEHGLAAMEGDGGVGRGAAVGAQRERVMKAMAQRRLEAEVAQLQADYHAAGTAGAVLAAVLVPDTNALATSLTLVSELAASKQFQVVVPMAVVAALDTLKAGDHRVHRGARAAIRALQEAMHAASSHLRVQFVTETVPAAAPSTPAAPVPLAPLRATASVTPMAGVSSGPGSQPIDDHVAIMACARYFVGQGRGRSGVVTILSADTQLAALAAAEGVPCQSASDFLRRFRATRRHERAGET